MKTHRNCNKFKEILVVKFQGGLGNQMFQYALYKKLCYEGKDVRADLSWYDIWNKKFDLYDAFPSVVLNTNDAALTSEKYKAAHKNRKFIEKVLHKIFPNLRYKFYEKEDGTYQKDVLKYQRGILDGYWQTEKYWSDIKELIKKELSFSRKLKKDCKLLEMTSNYNTVSVHIRRGDYLLPENQALFGNICTYEYYEKAIQYMRENVPNIRFVFFTNDSEWVKENFNMSDGFFANDYYEQEMPDYYDMYMMSQCKHHIIANSTFSWWGAYLGKNKDKIVIAPSKWMNGKETRDIYQSDWIKL